MIALDASAVLAILRNETGAQVVERAVIDNVAVMSTANLAEVLQKVATFGIDANDAATALERIGVVYVDLSQTLARLIAAMHRAAPALSLADRSCFAVARIFGARALTSDRIWARYAADLGVEVELIRAA